LSDSKGKYKLLDLERDLPTTREDNEVLWALAKAAKDAPVDMDRLLDPFWTLEKAAAKPLFTDEDEPFEL
jgi:hypothetical protein